MQLWIQALKVWGTGCFSEYFSFIFNPSGLCSAL